MQTGSNGACSNIVAYHLVIINFFNPKEYNFWGLKSKVKKL